MSSERAHIHGKAKTMLLAIAVLAALSAGCLITDSCGDYDRAFYEKRRYQKEALQRDDPSAGQAEPQEQPSGGGTDAASAEPVVAIGNPKAVQNGGTSPTWEAETSMIVTEINTYHWNDGKGKSPGTLALQSGDGKTYGPWQTSGLPGQGGVPNATWVAKPDEVVPPGTYKVVDSDPGSWSQNADSKGVGFTNVIAAPAE
ncbi:MAG: hypothetical protein U1E26_08785 [Coriobacteriia bacterium]|nr:hypothetical protein [Coriobacteriia bacterium]